MEEGAQPVAPMTQGTDGNFYGVTSLGGTAGSYTASGVGGTIYKLTPAGVYTKLYTFPSPNQPVGGLVLGNDGNFYGVSMTNFYRITPDGNFTDLYDFVNSYGGPSGGIVLGSDGNFWGTTAFGGANAKGSIFKFTPSGVLTTMHDFADGADSSDPYVTMIQAKDGYFYGETRGNSYSTPHLIFKISTAGAFSVVYTFSGVFTDQPLVQATDGNFYGTAEDSIFQLTPAGAFKTIYTFTNTQTKTTQSPTDAVAALTVGLDGALYGTTYYGGTIYDSDPDGIGVIFRLTTSGSYSTIHPFGATDGGFTLAQMIVGKDGNLYGSTAAGGERNAGNIFEVTPSGTYTILHTLLNNGAEGNGPTACVIKATDGNFYGTTYSGGSVGNIFRVTPSGVRSTLYDFGGRDGANPEGPIVQAKDGFIYGTTYDGGQKVGITTYNEGTVYKIGLDGTQTVIHTFGDGTVANDGINPVGGLTLGKDGNLYGTTEYGGAHGDGTIFSITPAGVETVLYSFTGGNDGFFPTAGLVQASDGNFYGVSGSEGNVFQITPAGAFKVLGAAPGVVGAAMVQVPNGNLYGTYASGVFEVTLSGTITTIPTTFLAGEFTIPWVFGPLTVGQDGNLYGAEEEDFNGEGGTPTGQMFMMTPGGTETLLHVFTPPEGNGPTGFLQDTDGSFWGTAQTGGVNGDGTVFHVTFPSSLGPTSTLNEFAPATSDVLDAIFPLSNGGFLATAWGTLFMVSPTGQITTVHDFQDPYADTPRLILAKGTDGNYYGAESGVDIIFKVTPSGAYTQLATQVDANSVAGPAGDGAIYATIEGDGANTFGNIVKISGGAATIVHSFDGVDDGDMPRQIIVGPDGSIYGVTQDYFSDYAGTVFKLTTGGTFTTIHTTEQSFDLSAPGIMVGQNNIIYGYTSDLIFKIDTSDTYTLLHQNSGVQGTGITGLVQGTDGTLYGANYGGGTYSYGTLFQCNNTTGDYTDLHNLNGYADGGEPQQPLVFGADGALYGYTSTGGTLPDGQVTGHGTLFRMTTAGAFSVIHTFSDAESAGVGPLALGANGSLYGISTLGDDSNGSPYQVNSPTVPTLPATASASFTVGVAGSYQVPVNGKPAPTISSTTLPAGLGLNAQSGVINGTPTTAGISTVTLTSTNSGGSATGSLTITVAKGTGTVTLGGLSATYNGSAATATATTKPTGLGVGFTYNGSATAPTNAGSYTVVGTISNANYAGSATGTLVIGKATASVTLGSLAAVYDGTSKSATATTVPSGLNVTFTYGGSATPPTALGTYNVVATVNNANYTGTATGKLVISPNPNDKEATITLSGLTGTYTGSPHVVTATTNPTGLNVTLTYNGSGTPPTAAGSYPIAASVNQTVSGVIYTGSSTGTLVISPAAVKVTVASATLPYDGSAQPAVVTTTPTGVSTSVTYNNSATVPVAVGSYNVAATVTNPNYAGSGTGKLVITAGVATVQLNGLTATYDGTAKTVTTTTTPSGLPVTITYGGKATVPVNVGSYKIAATVDDPNYTGSATGTLVIAKATATVHLIGLAATYTGKTISAGATTTPVGLPVTFAYTQNGKKATPLSPGSYTVVGTVNSPNAAGSATGTLVISLAPPTVYLSAAAAEVSAFINPAGVATTVYVQYGLTNSYGIQFPATPQSAGNGKVPIDITIFLSGLAPHTLYHYRVVTVTNGVVTDGPDETFTTPSFDTTLVAATGSTYLGLGNAAVNAGDEVAFAAKIAGGTGIFANYGSAVLNPVAATGSLAPGAGGSVFATLTDPVYSNNQEVAFGGTLKVAPGLATKTNDTGVWLTQTGVPGLLAREGSVAPGTGGATFATFTAIGLTDDAGAIIAGTVAGGTPAVSKSNDAGVWEGSSNLTLMLRSGETVVTSSGTKTIASFKFLPVETVVGGQTRGFDPASGHLAATATYTDKTTGIIRVTTAAEPSEIAISGGAATGIAGATYATFSNPAINSDFDVVFMATVKGAGISTSNDTGIWIGSGTSLLAQTGSNAPDASGASLGAPFATFGDPVENTNGAVAFLATLKLAKGQTGASGIWCDSTGSLTLTVRQGDPAAGCPTGVTYGAFTSLALDDVGGSTQQGGVIFVATLAGVGVSTSNNTGIFGVDNTGAVQLIVRTGDVFGAKTVTALSFLPVETTTNALVAGQTRSFSASTGDLVYNATFDDKSTAIYSVVFP